LTQPEIIEIRKLFQLTQTLKLTSIIQGNVDAIESEQLKALLQIKESFPNLTRYKIDSLKLLGNNALEDEEKKLLDASKLQNTPMAHLNFSQLLEDEIKANREIRYSPDFLREVAKFTKAGFFGSEKEVKEALLIGNLNTLQKKPISLTPSTLEALKKLQEIVFTREKQQMQQFLGEGQGDEGISIPDASPP
jgi:hypothetical protein